jgi:hypothetical protein
MIDKIGIPDPRVKPEDDEKNKSIFQRIQLVILLVMLNLIQHPTVIVNKIMFYILH